MTTPVAIVAAVAGIGAYALYVKRNSASAEAVKEPFASFGFHQLRLESSELVNHNTKRLRFELPDPNVKSGLSLTSAVLTISFPNGGWIPCIRPYTPTNDLSMALPSSLDKCYKLTVPRRQRLHRPDGKALPQRQAINTPPLAEAG